MNYTKCPRCFLRTKIIRTTDMDGKYVVRRMCLYCGHVINYVPKESTKHAGQIAKT